MMNGEGEFVDTANHVPYICDCVTQLQSKWFRKFYIRKFLIKYQLLTQEIIENNKSDG